MTQEKLNKIVWSNELRMLINNLTQDIINIYNIQIPIINIDEVVIRLGGHIEESFAMNNMSDGSIQKQDDGFIIFVSPFQSAERRTFTIAHELGHLFLHMGYQINGELWEKSDNLVFYEYINPEKELEANEFASALLMPKNKYKEIMDKNTIGNVVKTKKIANFFGVSVSEALNRGISLGYLKTLN